MNWLVIVVVLFLASYILRGYHNGFIKTVFSIFAVAIALIVATAGSPMVSKTLQEQEGIYSFIEEKVASTLQIDQAVDGKADKAEETKVIEGLSLPESIRLALIENNNTGMYATLAAGNFSDYIASYITCMILNAISYIVLFLVALIVIRIVANLLDLVSKLPILNSINKIGGLCVGLLHGLIILWVLCIVLTVFSGTNVGQVLFEQINDSILLSVIYNNNLFMQFLMRLAQTLLIVI